MVFCTYCGHSFTRDEHLERHILTHTNVKPFKCFTCHMSFARRDLLQRHYTVHGKTQDQQEVPAANGMMLKSAGRTPIACSNCAKTKTKCDKKFPCTRCATRNLKCTLRPTRRSTKNAARMGLITPETLAAGLVGILPPDHVIAAENVAEPDTDDCDHDEDDMHCSSPPVARMSSSTQSPKSSSQSSSVHLDSASESSQDDAPDDKAGTVTPPTRADVSPMTPLLGQDFPNSFVPFQDPNGSKNAMTPSSPRFMLDWQQLHLPMDYDPLLRQDFFGNPDLNLDISSMAIDSHVDPMLGCYTDLSPTIPESLLTPMETPVVERAMPEFMVNPGLAIAHGRNQSMVSSYSVDSFADMSHHHHHPGLASLDPVLVAQVSWNSFRCVPGTSLMACPTTARWNLETLESSLRDHDGWSNWTPDVADLGINSADKFSVMKLHESTRDKLLAITQGFLHKALEIHRGTACSPDMSSYALSNFVLLPPAKILEFFLRSYSNSFERYYKITSRGTLDTNELMHCYNDKASSLLVLLMVAEGAMSIPSIEARALTLGLIEACRISLFDLIERNVHMAGERNVLHAALIFTSVAAWGGDKWQMDIAMGQRAIYMSMLRHSGMLQGATPLVSMGQDAQVGKDQAWNSWMGQESHSRLVHAWAMIDQELALFHDTAPILSVTEFAVRLPHDDEVWQAKTAGEWSSAVRGTGKSGVAPAQPHSLRDLFRHFLDDEMDSVDYPLTSTHIRLLLHSLQGMVCHYSQLMSCFSDSGSSRARSKSVTASSTRCRVEEVQCLLQRWFALATKHSKARPNCATLHVAFILYHLISLNTCTSFPAIEQLARRESFDGTYASLVWAHKRCITDVSEALFHCGQVLRLMRTLPRANRPAWWPAAIYRAGLVLWCDSLINKDAGGGASTTTVAIDALPAEHPAVRRYLNKGDGTPCLTTQDGKTVSIEHGVAVLEHCISVLDEGVPTRFQEGIRAKLELLMRS